MRRIFLLVVCFLFLGFVNLFATGTTAQTVISNGGDAGTVVNADTDGDTFLTYDAGPSSGVVANTVTSTVMQVYGLGVGSIPNDQNNNSNNDLYFLYTATNTGNAGDFVTISTSLVQGVTWYAAIIEDSDQSGTHEIGETTVISGLSFGKDVTKYFFVKVSIPVSASHYSTSTLKIAMKAQNGAGTNPGDGWGDIDLREDTLNASCVDTLAPSRITSLRAQQSAQGGQLDLTWSAPGDDPTIGQTASYLIRYSTQGDITEANWATATVFANNITPKTASGSESASLTGLTPGTTYWVAVKSLDEVPFTSTISTGIYTFATPISGANLSLVKARDLANPKPGERITYTLSYSNTGTTAANNVVVKDRIPANCDYAAGTLKLNTVAKTDGVDGDEASITGTVVTVNVGTVAAGVNGTVEFKVDVR